MREQRAVVTAQQVRREYEKGAAFKSGLKLYEIQQRNERFYTGDQWYGLKTRKIQPVVLNVLRRVVSTFQALVVSNDIGYEITPFLSDEGRDTAAKVVEGCVSRVIEKQKIRDKNYKALRMAATTGDMCMYFSFDPEIETGQMMKGDIEAELLMGTNVIFGNPYTNEVQKQPFIILVRRRPLQVVKEEARRAGVADWDSIQGESGAGRYMGEEDSAGDDLVTELTRLWKVREDVTDENGIRTGTRTRVHFMRVCGEIVTAEQAATKMTLYPIAWGNWLDRVNCMHGISPITEAIPTQIAINKQATSIISFTHNVAYPKLVYDVQKFPNGYDPSPGTAIAVKGNPNEVVTNVIGGVQQPASVVSVLDMMIRLLKDSLGASDVSLGDVRPDNQGAILAAQAATNAPLELQKRTFEQFNEDCIRVIVDMMCAYYGQRTVNITRMVQDPMTGMESEMDALETFDFDALEFSAMEINVEVGAASYWSELAQSTTMSNLYDRGMLPDMLTFFEAIPPRSLPNKRQIIRKLREKMERDALAAQQMPAPEPEQAVQPQAIPQTGLPGIT